ncbi:lycopene epsilon cyclase, chloroplastic isoform X1 [Typha angustifolia]|uniref:lycopene epsilon cyclase, chloroplastic isoform X1 n=1 Tax=Typha angustifolia TaxID=59011 RepID=UPI003C30076E
MECLGRGSSAAISVSFDAWRFRRRRTAEDRILYERRRSLELLRPLRVRAASGGRESCAATEMASVAVEEFADDEDSIKAGGSEIFFVKMQEKKLMEKQSKIADKLSPISTVDSILDLVVIGCGPAGLSLAAESAKKGLSVGLIGPDLPFTNNYGVWEDEFKDLGLESCIEHVWRDTIVYLDNDDPILIGRAYGRVDRDLLHEELLRRCCESGVTYLNSKVERIIESSEGCSLVSCESDCMIPCRLAIVASGAASGKLLEYEVGGPRVSVQTAYGVEVEVENNPYDPSLMVFMDYRDYVKDKKSCPEAEYPTFLYVMPMSSTRVFYEETCLASKDAMPFDLLKKKLMSRLEDMGVQILKVYEEEWSYIPVGGSLPNTDQKILAFGAAASMVHPATGYSVVRSLSEAPRYASVIANILKKGNHSRQNLLVGSIHSPSMLAWRTLWPQERKRQRAFFLFGLALILQLDIEGIRTFFQIFFRLPNWMWQGFLGSTLSSVDLILFASYMFAIAPNSLRMCLVRHLLSDPTGAIMIKTYLAL